MQGNYTLFDDAIGTVGWLIAFVLVSIPIGGVLVGGGIVYAVMTSIRISVGG